MSEQYRCFHCGQDGVKLTDDLFCPVCDELDKQNPYERARLLGPQGQALMRCIAIATNMILKAIREKEGNL